MVAPRSADVLAQEGARARVRTFVLLRADLGVDRLQLLVDDRLLRLGLLGVQHLRRLLAEWGSVESFESHVPLLSIRPIKAIVRCCASSDATARGSPRGS